MRIGFCNGCFDGYHLGHRYFLKTARQQCDWLIVAVNTDESVRSLKGEGRPMNSLDRRLRDITVNGWGHAVIPFEGDPVPLLQSIRPAVLFRGEDQSTFHVEHSLIGELVTIKRLQGFSTSAMLPSCANLKDASVTK